MDINSPYQLNLPSAINFCNEIEALPKTDEYIFDWGNMKFVEPFGMLLVGAKRRQLMSKYPDAKYYDRDFKGNTYAANMGFFKSILQDYGKEPGELDGNLNYIPIKCIEVSEIEKKSYEEREHFVDTVEREALKIAQVLCKKEDEILDVLTYSIREIMRNVIEHSQSDKIWYAGQYWPSKDRVEITILDEGIGIQKSLEKNKRLKIKSDEDALLLSLEPGISSKTFNKGSNDPYQNSGFGLYMTSSICKEGGDFVIGSCTKALGTNVRGTAFRELKFQGTIIRMRLIVSKIPELKELQAKLIKEGESIARKNSKQSILTASKISRLLITKDNQ